MAHWTQWGCLLSLHTAHSAGQGFSTGGSWNWFECSFKDLVKSFKNIVKSFKNIVKKCIYLMLYLMNSSMFIQSCMILKKGDYDIW